MQSPWTVPPPPGPGPWPRPWKTAASTPGCAASRELSTRSNRNERSDAYVAMSAATRPTAASAITPRTSRARSDSGPSTRLLLPELEHVAGLPDRLDEGRAEQVELLAQIAHVGLDDVRVAAEVVAPDVLEDLALREDAARVEHEVAQQAELGSGQLDPGVAAQHLVPLLVEHEIGEAEHVAGQDAAGAAQDRLHARDHLGEAERLRH